MACLNMFNNEQQGHCPRISFSNDFVDTQQSIKHEKSYREAPVSSDFEFSAPTYTMNNTADELFFKGKLLPLKENCSKMTLRDELLINDDDSDQNVFPRIPKGSSRWKERLGLMKRTHNVPKKAEKSFGTLETIEEVKKAMLVHEEELIEGPFMMKEAREGGFLYPDVRE